MTAEEEIALLNDYLATCTRLSSGFNLTAARLVSPMPVDAGRIDNLTIDNETIVLAFLKRFEQFEDALHRTLKAISKIMEHGMRETLNNTWSSINRFVEVEGLLA